MVTIPRMVTIQLQPFFYRTQIWLSEILTGQDFGSQISLPDMLIPKLNTFDLSLVVVVIVTGQHQTKFKCCVKINLFFNI